jgi:hypothetical protein
MRGSPTGRSHSGWQSASGRAAVENFQTIFLTLPAPAANRSLVRTTYTSVGERSLPFRVADLPEQQPARLTIATASRS